MNITDAVSCMCDLAKGEAEQFDIIASNSHSEGISVFQGQVQNTEISDSVGLGIRVIKDGHPGYAHTERLTRDAIAQTIKDAVSTLVASGITILPSIRFRLRSSRISA